MNPLISLIIFDLDGVLVDARDLHYDALNLALYSTSPEYVIGRAEHLSKYDGLNTKKKLEMLTRDRNLPVEKHDEICKLKQQHTSNLIQNLERDDRIASVLKSLKKQGFKIAVASNSIRETVKLMLLRKGFLEHIDFYYSNEDVIHPKPSSEIYMRCMIKANVSAKETLIVEDSHIGRSAALSSGAYLFGVNNSNDVQFEQIMQHINSINSDFKSPKWQGGSLKVLIPMAGAGSRFEKAGYVFPKPLIEVNGTPMIKTVVDNLNVDAQFIYIVRKEQYEKYNLKTMLEVMTPNCKIIQVDYLTEGAACTTLLAKEYINNEDSLLIANSDQFVEWDSNEFFYSMVGDSVDGGILTFKNVHPKWSYVKLNEDGFVSEVREKEVISDIATVGIYFWKRGSDYVKYAEQMISKNIRVNNEFYVAPVYNESICDGKRIKIFNIRKMWGLGTPDDLNHFIQNYGKK